MHEPAFDLEYLARLDHYYEVTEGTKSESIEAQSQADCEMLEMSAVFCLCMHIVWPVDGALALL